LAILVDITCNEGLFVPYPTRIYERRGEQKKEDVKQLEECIMHAKAGHCLLPDEEIKYNKGLTYLPTLGFILHPVKAEIKDKYIALPKCKSCFFREAFLKSTWISYS